MEIKLSMPMTLLLTPGKVECKLIRTMMTIQMLQKVENKNMNEVPHCWKIVREETKGRNQKQDCTDPEN